MLVCCARRGTPEQCRQQAYGRKCCFSLAHEKHPLKGPKCLFYNSGSLNKTVIFWNSALYAHLSLVTSRTEVTTPTRYGQTSVPLMFLEWSASQCRFSTLRHHGDLWYAGTSSTDPTFWHQRCVSALHASHPAKNNKAICWFSARKHRYGPMASSSSKMQRPQLHHTEALHTWNGNQQAPAATPTLWDPYLPLSPGETAVQAVQYHDQSPLQ